jgi:hypothetical protein
MEIFDRVAVRGRYISIKEENNQFGTSCVAKRSPPEAQKASKEPAYATET